MNHASNGSGAEKWFALMIEHGERAKGSQNIKTVQDRMRLEVQSLSNALGIGFQVVYFEYQGKIAIHGPESTTNRICEHLLQNLSALGKPLYNTEHHNHHEAKITWGKEVTPTPTLENYSADTQNDQSESALHDDSEVAG